MKKTIVKEAIKKVAPNCKGNFEIPMSAISYIEYGNRLRKKPIRASYNYTRNNKKVSSKYHLQIIF